MLETVSRVIDFDNGSDDGLLEAVMDLEFWLRIQ